MTRLESFPKYFREESSPKFIDSAFPPFKIEHRYRGVYERAGFDVNLGGVNNKSDSSSIQSRSHQRQGKSVSPQHSRMNHTNPYGSSTNTGPTSRAPRTGSQTSHGGSTNSLTSLGSGERYRTQTFRSQTTASQTSLPKRAYQKPLQPYQSATSQSNPSIHSELSSDSLRSNLTHIQDLANHLGYQKPYGHAYEDPYSKPTTAESLLYGGSAPEISTAANPYAASNPYAHQAQKSILHSIPDSIHRSHFTNPSMDGDFDFSPQPNNFPSQESEAALSYSNSTYSRNKKNLSIKIQDSNYRHDDIDTQSVPSPNMFYDNSYNVNGNSSTQNTSVNRDANGLPDLTGAVVEDAPPSHYQHQNNDLPYQEAVKRPYEASNNRPYQESNSHLYQESNNYLYPESNSRPYPEPENELPYPIHRDQSLIKKNKRLSSSLDDFKRDVEDVKKHTPSQKQEPRFETLQDVSNHLNLQENDYSKYLNTQTPEGQHPRHSQMSMVSSILSKDSVNDEDAEIERELERQLQSLKTGERAEVRDVRVEEAREVASEEASHQYAAAAATAAAAPVPTFNIQTEDQYETSMDTQVPTSTPYPTEENLLNHDLNEIDDDVPPRAIPLQTNEPFDPRVKSRQRKEYNDEPQYPEGNEVGGQVGAPDTTGEFDQSYDSVQGLSINHKEVATLEEMDNSIEKELKFLNFPIDSAPAPKQESRGVAQEVYPPGKGPCRTCFRSVLSNGTGSQKAIFSKSGELSGQWHRSCFECNYDTCTIKFKKGIQCYALNDKPYCHNHYHELNDTLCQQCNEGIEGECIENELGQKWHLRCLNCQQCRKGIQEDYYLINGQVFCETDALYRIEHDRNKSKQDKIEKRRTRLLFVD